MFKSRAGQVIEYIPFGGGTRKVYVTQHEDDVKNGQPGFEGHILDDPDFLVWGYDRQITRIL